MRVLIVQQLTWGQHIGHEMARTLCAEGNAISALVYGQEGKEFVERQTEVPYEHVVFADPLYDEGHDAVSEDMVREIEERYNLRSLWRVVYSDRLLAYSFLSSRRFVPQKPVSNEYLLSVCWRTYGLVQELMDRAAPDYVVAPVIGALPNYLLYLECQHRKVPFFTFAPARFGKYFYVADDQYLCSRAIDARFRELMACPETSSCFADAQQLYAKIRQDDPGSKPAYARSALEQHTWSARTVLRAARELALLPARLVRALTRGRRVMAIRNIWVPSNSRLNTVRSLLLQAREQFITADEQFPCLRSMDQVQFRYVFFPLHVEPEVSLMVFAPEYADQIEVCRRVAQALPAGIRLLVKEHPGMVSSRPRGFYDELRGLLNVELVHSAVSSHTIYSDPRCQAVLGVSSSVCFEAAMNSQPVVMLAPPPYRGLPTVSCADSLHDAIDQLRAHCLGVRPGVGAEVDRLNLAVLSAILEQSFSLDYVERWQSGRGRLNSGTLVRAVQARFEST